MDDNETYAKLLSSIKVANTGFRRPLSPIQTAYLIEQLISEEGNDVALSLLPIEKKIMSDFLSLKNNLPEQCHDAIVWGRTNDLGVGFSAAHFISTLNDENEKLLLFSEASKNSFDVGEINRIIRYYKEHNLSLEEVIEKETNSRPQISTTYLVVISISENSKKKLEEISKKIGIKSEEILNNAIKKKFQISEIVTIQMKGKNVAIGFKKEGYRKYKQQISRLGLDYDKITEYLVNENDK